ncbi:unnamed protein product, partial [Rotaria sp. Silwood2]
MTSNGHDDIKSTFVTIASNRRIRVKLRHSITIPSHTEEMVEAFTTISQASKVLFSQEIIQIQDYCTNLIIININDYPLYLTSDTILGFI